MQLLLSLREAAVVCNFYKQCINNYFLIQIPLEHYFYSSIFFGQAIFFDANGMCSIGIFLFKEVTRNKMIILPSSMELSLMYMENMVEFLALFLEL